MSLTVIAAKLTGIPGASGWAQVHEYTPDDSEKRKLRGNLYTVVATTATEAGVGSVEAGRELLARLHEEYYGKLEGTAFNTLRAALEKVISEFNASWGSVEVAAVAHVEGVVYTAVGGGAEASIFRNGMLAKILTSDKSQAVAASGYPKEGDMLLLGTKLFFGSVPAELIKTALETGDPKAAGEQLSPFIHTRENTGTLGATILSFGNKTAEAPPEIQKISTNFAKASLAGISSILTKVIPKNKIYVRKDYGEYGEEGGEQKRKTIVSVGIILLALLIISIGFGVVQKKIKDKKSVYLPRLTTAIHEFEEAQGLFTLNPDRARELYFDSQKIASELKSAGIKDKQLDTLVKNLAENEGRISGSYKTPPDLFLDLSLLSSGFSGDDLSGSGNNFFVLDKKGKKAISVTFSTKKSKVVAGPSDMLTPKALASYEDRSFVLEDDGLYELGVARKKLAAAEWAGDVMAYVYAGNLYVLEKTGNVIWRYPAAGSEFGSKQKWLGAGVAPDFSNAVSWTIDGNVWVLSSAGNVLRFSLGSPQAFSLGGVAQDLASASAVYTNEDLGYLYILDTSQKRVVVVDKKGVYRAQYIDDKLKDATDLVVSEKEKKIIFLAGSKLYSIEIKHF